MTQEKTTLLVLQLKLMQTRSIFPWPKKDSQIEAKSIFSTRICINNKYDSN